MKIGLFIPCYIDQLYPQVGRASLEVLEKVGCEVTFLEDILCCGQPMDNSGFEHFTREKGYAEPFLNKLEDIDFLVVPSASCAYHLIHHLLKGKISPEQREKIKEITEFLHDIKPDVKLESRFPHRVGLHQSCHGLRGLNLAKDSEVGGTHFSKIENVLSNVEGLELIIPPKSDECCGFGGSFAIFENAVSVKMGEDKMKNVQEEKVGFLTATDMSCLMHLEGIINKNNSEVKVLHITEILNSQ